MSQSVIGKQISGGGGILNSDTFSNIPSNPHLMFRPAHRFTQMQDMN
jgi:hypothetical protein